MASGPGPKQEQQGQGQGHQAVKVDIEDEDVDMKPIRSRYIGVGAARPRHAPVPDAGLLFHTEEIKKLELIRGQMEPELRKMRDKLPKMKKVRPYQVTHIENPHHFYIKYADVEFPVELLDHRMQEYYRTPGNLVNLKYDPAFDVKLYLWRYTSPDGYSRWERVRAYARNRGDRICKIFLIDVGLKEIAPYEEMYELNPEFAATEPRAIRVYLLDTAVPNDGWSDDAVEVFKKIALNQEFKGIGLNKFSEADDSEFLEHCERYGVILFHKKLKCTLNGEVCRLGIAKAAGYSAGRYELLEDYEKNADNDNRGCDFDVIKFAALLSDENVASELGVDPESADEIIKYIQHGVEREKQIVPVIQMPKPIKSRLFRGICGTFLNPSCFYIIMYEKLPLYETMVTYMENILDKIEIVRDPMLIKVGTLFLVFLTDEQSQKVHRAVAKEAPKIIGKGEANNYFVKVLLIDLGRSVSARVGTLRLLPENLCKIPPFAHRVHLDPRNIRPSGGVSWHPTASNACRRACGKPTPAGICYLWSHSKSAVLELHDFDAEISFDMGSKKWIVKPPRSCGEGAPADLTLLKSNPMLRPLLNSVGVELSFEVAGPSKNPYLSVKQDTLTDTLKELGDAENIN